jgi:hypothetical protein
VLNRVVPAGVVFAILLLCTRASADEATYEFKRHYREGQAYNVLFNENFEMVFEDNYQGRSLGHAKLVDSLQDKGRLTIEKTEDGYPVVEKIEIDKASGEFSQFSGENPKQENDKLAGKTVTVERGANGHVSCEVDGVQNPKFALILKTWLNRDEEIYPDHPVKLSDRWELSRKIGHMIDLADDQEVNAFGTLKTIRISKGRPFAEVGISYAMVGSFREHKDLHFEMQMEGSAWVDLSTGRIATLDLAGEIHANGTIDVQTRGGAAKINANGTGPIEFHQRSIAAKPRSETPIAGVRELDPK